MDFTIRVYGLLFKNEQVLLSRENIKGEVHTKFPGGGLEYGEGLKQCVERELMEEAGIVVKATELFYLTENFIKSAFHEQKQVISVYYHLNSSQAELKKIVTTNPKREDLLAKKGDQVLFWCPLSDLNKQNITLPIDKEVVKKLTKAFVS